MFEARIYIERRERLRKQVGSGLILLQGNDESPMNYADNTYAFRQDSSFLYFFGLDAPGLTGVLDAAAGTDTIYGDDLTVEDFVWMGYQPTLAERSAAVGVSRTGTRAELAALLGKTGGKKVHFLPPYREGNLLKLWNWLGTRPEAARQQASPALIEAVVAQRMIKSPEEIAQIEEAVNTSVDMHVAAMRMVRPGLTEAQVAAAVHAVALAAGGNIAFPIIATVHGETLHNHYHGNTLGAGGMFLLDAGAENAMHYAGDLSSTMPIDRRFTARQKDIFDVVLAAHEAAVASLKPGVRHMDTHQAACRTLVKGLQALGLMQGDAEEAVQAGAHALFFPCGVGHMMGLDVHDMEDLGEVCVGYAGEPKSTQFGLKSLRLGRKLEPGFVLTTEPGVYFIPQLIDQWRAEGRFKDFIHYDRVEAYRNFGGIRNEENYLITAEGHRRLGKYKPMTTAEVEAERG